MIISGCHFPRRHLLRKLIREVDIPGSVHYSCDQRRDGSLLQESCACIFTLTADGVGGDGHFGDTPLGHFIQIASMAGRIGIGSLVVINDLALELRGCHWGLRRGRG